MTTAICLAAPTAFADIADRAKELIDKGLRLYNTQDYKGAIAAWREAYVLVPSPDTLFGIGQAQRLDGDCTSALVTYRTVLRQDIPREQVGEVQKVIDVCEQTLAAHKATTEPVQPKQERPDPVQPAQPVQPQADSTSPWYKDAIGGTLMGLGIAGVATGATFLVLARQAERNADDAAAYQTFDGFARTAERDRTISLIAFGAGGALMIAGVIRYITRPSGSSPRVSAMVGPSGGVVSLQGAF